jgi:hypothetical protein
VNDEIVFRGTISGVRLVSRRKFDANEDNYGQNRDASCGNSQSAHLIPPKSISSELEL